MYTSLGCLGRLICSDGQQAIQPPHSNPFTNRKRQPAMPMPDRPSLRRQETDKISQASFLQSRDHLMGLLVCKAHNLVLNGGAVSGAFAVHPAPVHWRLC